MKFGRRDPVSVRVIPHTALTWRFGARAPAFEHDSFTAAFDPFPAYSHDPSVVRVQAEDVAERWPPLVPVTFWLPDREISERTNGWSTHELERDEEDDDRWVIARSHVMLSGKRIPIHPAVTRYLVAHEYGHHVQWWLEQLRKLDHDALLEEYGEIRGLKGISHGEGGRWAGSIQEVFADDFRLWICKAEEEFWPHAQVPLPEPGGELDSWWARAIEEWPP